MPFSRPVPPAEMLLSQLRAIAGPSRVLSDTRKTARYCKGFRSGQGRALAVVFPDTLLAMWRIFKACVEADRIILMQAANTGLTEGSAPSGDDYDRELVIINTLRLGGVAAG